MALITHTIEEVQSTPNRVYKVRAFYGAPDPGGADQLEFLLPYQEAAVGATGAGPLTVGFPGYPDNYYWSIVRTDFDNNPWPSMNGSVTYAINGTGTPSDPFRAEAEIVFRPGAALTGGATVIVEYTFEWYKQAEFGTQTFSTGV